MLNSPSSDYLSLSSSHKEVRNKKKLKIVILLSSTGESHPDQDREAEPVDGLPRGHQPSGQRPHSPALGGHQVKGFANLEFILWPNIFKCKKVFIKILKRIV